MPRIDYRCRNPFNTRLGQFEEGKHTLVVGVDRLAFEGKNDGHFYMTIGKNNSKIYRMTYEKLRDVKHTVWKNQKGHEVWIIPLAEFDETTL